MSKISEEVSKIFGFGIREGEWQRYLPQLDIAGEPTRKNMAALIFAVCAELEELEKRLSTPEVVDKGVKNVERTTPRRNTKITI